MPPNVAPEISTRYSAVGFPVSVDPAGRTMEVTISTPSRDRQGDVVEPRGLDFKNFLKNPVVLWAHDSSRPPVGKVLAVEVNGEGVRAKVEFAETEFASEVFELYAGGFLHAWSIGFIPLRWERLSDEDGSAGFHIHEAEVVELSAVPVPANPEALTHALKSVNDETLKKAISDTIDKAGKIAVAKPKPKPGQKPKPESESEEKPQGKAFSADQLHTLAATMVNTLAEKSARSIFTRARGVL